MAQGRPVEADVRVRAIELIQSGRPTNAIARELAIAPSSVSDWGGWRDPDEPESAVHAFVFISSRTTTLADYPIRGHPSVGESAHRCWPPEGEQVHAAASRMIAAGIDLTVVAEILGHANINVLIRVYAHVLEERKKAAAGLLEAAWSRVLHLMMPILTAGSR